MKTNTYGLKIKGLRKAAGETKTTRGYYSGLYVQISYSPTDGQVLYNTLSIKAVTLGVAVFIYFKNSVLVLDFIMCL